jgi:hypothetical protein
LDSIKEDIDIGFLAEDEVVLRELSVELDALHTSAWALVWKNLVLPIGLLGMGAYFLAVKGDEFAQMDWISLPVGMIIVALIWVALYARSRAHQWTYLKSLNQYVFTNFRIVLTSTENQLLDCIWKAEVRDVFIDPSGDLIVERDPDDVIPYFWIRNISNVEEIFEFVKANYVPQEN